MIKNNSSYCTHTRNILEIIDLAQQMIACADKGDEQRVDESCGVLFGILKDCAYKVFNAAQKEIEVHRRNGSWDGPPDYGKNDAG